MIKAFKYRIYPTIKQTVALEEQLRLCRLLYNMALEQRTWAWRSQKKNIGMFEQMRQLTEMKTEFKEFKQVHSSVLQNVLRRLDFSYQRFFSGTGFPRFKNQDRFRTMQFNNTGFKLDGNRLQVSKIGRIKIRVSRPLEGKVFSLLITKNAANQWYVSFCCKIDLCIVPVRLIKTEVGIDLGVEKFLTASDGSMVPNPRHGRKNTDILKQRQQVLSKKRKGSNNRKKAKVLVAKAYLKVNNQRKDHHFKVVNCLLKTYDRMFYEKLNIVKMTKSTKGTVDNPNKDSNRKSGLNKSIMDAGWSQFLDILRFKAESAGVEVVAVNPAYTSQFCSSCGVVVEKDLSERVHSCSCGLIIDRDWNAALNIFRLGQSHVLKQNLSDLSVENVKKGIV
jgi:putative transposase